MVFVCVRTVKMFRVQQPHWCNAPHVRNVVMGYEKCKIYGRDSHGSQASLGLGHLWPMSFDANAEPAFPSSTVLSCKIVLSRGTSAPARFNAVFGLALWAISGCGGKHRLLSMRPQPSSPSNVSWKHSADQCQSRRSHCRQGGGPAMPQAFIICSMLKRC